MEIIGDLFSKDSRQITDFFAQAAEDETWSANHAQLMQKLIDHLSHLFIEENLAMELAMKTGKVLQAHPALLQKAPKDLLVHVQGGEVEVNALLFAIASPLFANLAHTSKRGKVYLPEVPKAVFDIIKSYCERGVADDLWRHEFTLVLGVYTFSIEWELADLQLEASKILKRYLTRQNYLEVLLQTIENRWQEYYNEVILAANSYDLGVIFHQMPLPLLRLEFLDYRESAMDLFEKLKSKITHLGFFGAITDDVRFTSIIQETKGLLGLQLNETGEYSSRFKDIPTSIVELDLSMNAWVDGSRIKALLQHCPHIKRLSLMSLTNVDFKSLGILKSIPLENLILTRCTQIEDEDIVFICQCCPDLIQLDLEACERLTDKSLGALSKYLSSLEELNLSRLHISDVALIELCHSLKHLTSLNLERCNSISDKGILEGVQLSSSLRALNLTHTPISLGARNQLRKIRSSLKIT